MNSWKIYICASAFVMLTVLKLLLPGQALSLRQQVREWIERDDDYSELVTTLGERLAEERTVTGLLQAFRSDEPDGETAKETDGLTEMDTKSAGDTE